MPRVLTLEKSLSLLEAVLSSRDGVGTRSLAHRLKLNVATTHNIARTFCDRGYLHQDPETKSFRPGVRLILLGRHPSFLRSFTLSVAPVVDGIAEKLNESVLLATIDHGHVLNLKYVPSLQAVKTREAEDMSGHSYCTAVGKVLLASLTAAELECYLRCNPLRRFTSRTICETEKLVKELKTVLARDYATTRDEFCDGLSAIAVPVRDPWGVILASIGASAPTMRLQKTQHFKATLSTLKEAAMSLEEQWSQSRLADVLKLTAAPI